MSRLTRIIIGATGLAAAIAFLSANSQPAGRGFALPLAATIDARPLAEVSGMARSRSYSGTYWVTNDSGDTARIFAIDADGKTILPTYSRFSYYGEESEKGKKQWEGFRVLNGRNVDWEAMTIDANYLYVADTGNNFNDRRDLGIYALSEIDPTASTQSAVIKFMPVAYPEQVDFPDMDNLHFDAEALFSADDKLYLVTKHRKRRVFNTYEKGANLYRLDTQYTDRDNLLTLVDSNPDILAATGAELSPDGSTLAVISYTDLWLFDRPAAGDLWLSSGFRRYPLDTDVARQIETVAWADDATLLLTNEQRDLFRVTLAELAASTPSGTP